MLQTFFIRPVAESRVNYLLGLAIFIILAIALPDNAHAQSKKEHSPTSEQQVRAIIEKHLVLWNEQEKAKRDGLLKDIYASDIEMVDRHFVSKGLSQVDGFIAELHRKNPDFRFSHVKPIDTHHNIARMFWQLGNAAKPNAVTGMDLFIIKNGKVQNLYVFVDEPK